MRVESYLESSFVTYLIEKRASFKIKIQRALPKQQHEFYSRDKVEFLANLRLAGRIQRRRIRQAQDDEERKNIQGEIFSACWYFVNSSVGSLEKQEITSNASRSDLVPNLDNYSTIYSDLCLHMSHLNGLLSNVKVTDKTISLWISSILLSGQLCVDGELNPVQINPREQNILFKFLINLTYLLFGCEVQRNPGAFISHNLMLDLILDEQAPLSWKKAISDPEKETVCGGGLMPMSMGSYKKEDANKKTKTHTVKCARVLQKYYGFFAIRAYNYEGDLASESSGNEERIQINQMIYRENMLVKTWFAQRGHADKNIHEKIDILGQSCINWCKPQ